MSLNFATVDKDENSITNNLFSKDSKEKKHKNNFREAVDMEKYHTDMYKLQLKEAAENRIKTEKDAKKRMEDYNKTAKKIEERHNKFLAEIQEAQNKEWNKFKDDWYWKSYFENLNKPGYTPLDNYLDNMKDDRYVPIELSDGYYPIGEFEENKQSPDNYEFVANSEIYKTPIREYVYDYPNDIIYPNTPTPNPNSKVQNTNIETLFKIKESELNKENKEETKKETKNKNNENNENNDEEREDFSSVDPKLAQIYQKTLPGNNVSTTPIPKKRNIIFNYLYCIIFIIFLFLIFKS